MVTLSPLYKISPPFSIPALDHSFVDNAVNRATGTITLKETFANREKRLWPGQFVNVVLTPDMEPNVIMEHSQAVEKGLYTIASKRHPVAFLSTIP